MCPECLQSSPENPSPQNPHSHPLIYLRGVKHQELESIIQFIYLGEARLYEGSIDRFMEAVKDLQIKQLAECFLVAGNPFLNRKEHADNDHMISATSDSDILTNIDEENENNSRSIAYNTGGESGSQFYKCEDCEAVFKSKSGLWRHTSSKHEGIVYSCNQCEYKATTLGNLKTHQQSKHEGVEYSCNQCEYQATAQNNLKRHQQSKHEGVRYSCNQCEYQAAQQGNLRTHQHSKHEGITYSCNQCEYQTAWKAKLRKHNLAKHH
jgi:MoaA/NifB/PqqE/SkfB family radical SAM enzyme